MKLEEIAKVIEGVLFVAGEGIDVDIFKTKYELSEKELNKCLDIIKNRLNENSGINLIKYKTKIQLSSNSSIADEIVEILNPIREKALNKTALEVLSIIAYKQPITRLEIENIRGGANCDYAIQLLERNNLIEVVGRKDAVGKPLLFGTTEIFLRRFELQSLESLPNYQEVLSRIRIIHSNGDGLYRTFDVPTGDLTNEQEKISHEDLNEINKRLDEIQDNNN